MPARDSEQVIASAVQRGAISEGRAAHWRARARAGEDVSILDDMASVYGPQPVRAAAAGQRAGYRDVVTASVPPGVDPAWYAVNPLLSELQRDRPALVQAAMRDDPNPPRLFGDRDLPQFCGSGLDPAVLAGLPWVLRRPVAAAGSLAAAYGMVDQYAPPNGDSAGLLALRYHGANADYIGAFSAWLAGPRRDSVQQQLAETGGQPRHPATGQFTAASRRDDPVGYDKAAAAADAADYVGQALHDELFGNG